MINRLHISSDKTLCFPASVAFPIHLWWLWCTPIIYTTICLLALRSRYHGSAINFLCAICNAPRPLRQMSSSYSLLLPCHLLACCILPCHHPHCICMFSKLASVPVSSFLPLSVLSRDTLARARAMSAILFYKWPENDLGMG